MVTSVTSSRNSDSGHGLGEHTSFDVSLMCVCVNPFAGHGIKNVDRVKKRQVKCPFVYLW